MEDVPATDEPENVIPFREPKTMERVAENQNRYSIAEDAIEVPPSVEEVFQYSGVKSTASGATENARGTAAPLLAWSDLEARFDRERKARKQSSSRTWVASFARGHKRLVILIANSERTRSGDAQPQ